MWETGLVTRARHRERERDGESEVAILIRNSQLHSCCACLWPLINEHIRNVTCHKFACVAITHVSCGATGQMQPLAAEAAAATTASCSYTCPTIHMPHASARGTCAIAASTICQAYEVIAVINFCDMISQCSTYASPTNHQPDSSQPGQQFCTKLWLLLV